MSRTQSELLQSFAKKYVWWEPARSWREHPERIMAQVMEMGTFQDILVLEQVFGTSGLIRVLHAAEAGWFSPRSWHFWHYRLGMAKCGDVPPLPERIFA